MPEVRICLCYEEWLPKIAAQDIHRDIAVQDKNEKKAVLPMIFTIFLMIFFTQFDIGKLEGLG